ncbi:hypothetical protein VTK73DRAFT_3669 [Phialemonium thermophilum]|uniref:Major facilitator superfamily (MFS) profile domain-containing protein n=1 Tax=Phialemonium thermophilum TaxID=223376 RepID=A0ABR3VG20_9PEZI
MALSMTVLAVSTSIGSTGAGICAAVFLFVFNTFFAFGWCGLPWLIPAELVPLEIRAQANALSTSANWIFNFMVVMITPVAFSSIGWRTYIIFAVFNAATVPLIYFCYPETACRSLEEMDVIFAKATGVHSAVQLARSEPRHYGRHGELLRDVLPDVCEQVVGETKASPAADHLEVPDAEA